MRNILYNGISRWLVFINVTVVIGRTAVIIMSEAFIINREAVIIVKDLVFSLIDMGICRRARQCGKYGMSSCMSCMNHHL